MNIFAVKGDIVQTYLVTIDELSVKNTQAKIDEWNGKGELKETKAASLMRYAEHGKKIEIVSRNYAGKGEVFFQYWNTVETMDMYNYKYYQFTPHPLSKLCDILLKDSESLDYSKHLAQLLSWSSCDEEEMILVRRLIDAFIFKKISVEDVVESDLTLNEKRDILKKIMDAIRNTSQPRKIIISPKLYEEEVEKKIHEMEVYNTGIYAKKTCGKDFKYTPEQKVVLRRKILSSLPTVELIEKNKGNIF